MNRRDALTYLGASAASLGALAAGEAQAADAPGHMQHFVECANKCADCQVQCDSCFRHCAEQVAAGKKEHLQSMYSCIDCAEVCRMAAALSARGSSYAVAACEGCAKVCDDCAANCEKFPSDKHMADCAKACRDCAKACREMIKHAAK